MPSSMTHTYFGLDVYDKINTQSKEKISNSLEYFKLFSQGSDPFMFYNFLIGKKAKMYSDVQGIIHTKKTREFFITTIKYINEKEQKLDLKEITEDSLFDLKYQSCWSYEQKR